MATIAANAKQIDGRFAFGRPPVLMVHPHLDEAQAFKRNGKETGEKKFGATFVIEDGDELKAAKAAVLALAKAAWPGRALKELQFPFSSGTTAADERAKVCAEKGKEPDGEWQRGKALLKARGKYQPKLGVVRSGKIMDLDPARVSPSEIKAAFFFGEKVFLEVSFAPYEGGNGPDGITAYLNSVTATGTGTRLAGGGRSASETFAAYVGSVSDESVSRDMAEEEVPF